LCGAGAKDYICANIELDELWDILYENFQKGFLLGCGTHGKGDHSQKLKNGLAKSHAYGITDVRILHDKYGKTVRAIKLRNPWAQEMFTGNLSD
jgi:hypothetical protein